MPRRKRPGEWVVLYAEVPPEVKARLERAADANDRSTVEHLIWLIKKYTPPLDGAPTRRGKK